MIEVNSCIGIMPHFRSRKELPNKVANSIKTSVLLSETSHVVSARIGEVATGRLVLRYGASSAIFDLSNGINRQSRAKSKQSAIKR